MSSKAVLVQRAPLATASQAGPTARGEALPRLFTLALVFVSGAVQAAIGPWVPGYVERFHLSGTEAGSLVGVAGLAIVGVGLPAGSLADRFGTRRLTFAAGWALALGAIGQAAASSFVLLLASRLVFGLGYGVLWTAGLSRLARRKRRGRGAGEAVACSGAGCVAGPLLAGAFDGARGTTLMLASAGLVMAGLTLALARSDALEPRPAEGARPRANARSALGDQHTMVALAAVVVAGISSTVATLVAPLELHAAGASPSDIGLLFSLAGGVFVVVSWAMTLSRSLGARVWPALAAVAFTVVSFAPAVLSTSALTVSVMLCASTAARGALWTAAYPLAASGAERKGAGVGFVTGLLNVVWAATTLVAPLLAGALLGSAGPRGTFAATQLAVLAVLAACGACMALLTGRVAGFPMLGSRTTRTSIGPHVQQTKHDGTGQKWVSAIFRWGFSR